MPLQLTMPENLDADGQRLWHAFMAGRCRLQVAKRTHRAAKQALRASLGPAGSRDPVLAARYHAAREELADATDAFAIANQQYHAYRRVQVVRLVVQRLAGSGRPDLSGRLPASDSRNHESKAIQLKLDELIRA